MYIYVCILYACFHFIGFRNISHSGKFEGENRKKRTHFPKQVDFELLPHPSYFSDLAFSKLFLFSKLWIIHIIPRIWPLAKLFSTQTSRYFQGLILSDLCLMWNLNRVLAWKSFSSYEDVIGENRHTLKQNYYKTDIEKWVVTVLNSQIEFRQKKNCFGSNFQSAVLQSKKCINIANNHA